MNTMDIFTSHNDLAYANKSVAIVHCVSSCFTMGKGIAVQFRERYGHVEELKASNAKIGDIVVFPFPLEDRVIWPCYLVTKDLYRHKPKYEALERCLVKLAKAVQELNIDMIVLPKLGCGLDQLEWLIVRPMIEKCLSGLAYRIYEWAGPKSSSQSKTMASKSEEFHYSCKKCGDNFSKILWKGFSTFRSNVQHYGFICQRCVDKFESTLDQNVDGFLNEFRNFSRLFRNVKLMTDPEFQVLYNYLSATTNSGKWARAFLGLNKGDVYDPVMITVNQANKVIGLIETRPEREQCGLVHSFGSCILFSCN